MKVRRISGLVCCLAAATTFDAAAAEEQGARVQPPARWSQDVLDAFFESDKMKALASFQDLYVGLEPYRNNELLGGGVLKATAPAVFGLLAAIELHPSNKKSGGELVQYAPCLLHNFSVYLLLSQKQFLLPLEDFSL